MNILFITPSEVQPLNGGLERITASLSQALNMHYGHVCYFRNLQDNYTEHQWESYLLNHAIDVIIAQGADKRVAQLLPTLRQVINRLERKMVLLFAFHSNPGVELAKMDYPALFYRLCHGINIKANLQQLAWQLLEPITRKFMLRHLKNKYHLPYEYADKIILLSSSFIPEYRNISGDKEDKFTAIPNMLSFDEKIKPAVEKTTTVLIVSRMEERQKRIKLALRIWNETPHNGWTLKIVGAGEDLAYYKLYADRLGVQNVSFEGRKNPVTYYQEASIFMMTSAFEGWGLTLLEAQQCGCVPIVFDTYASLPDIVTDGQNGFIVPEDDIKQYVARLKQLMDDDEKRKQMAEKAVKDCQRYTPQKVAAQWDALFKELLNQ